MRYAGKCWDNACAESFFKTLKQEVDILKEKIHQDIEENAENFVPVAENEQAEIEMIIAAANKTKNINIRILEYGLEKVKQKSNDEGLPYQTLISSIIHKYIAGKLVDEHSVLKALQLLSGR
jgi:predicted DNA binding CopG/RHH family protein